MNELKTWVHIPEKSDFSIYNLPYGVFSVNGKEKKVGIAIGNFIIDLQWLLDNNYLNEIDVPTTVFTNTYINDFISCGKPIWEKLRKRLQSLLSIDNNELQKYSSEVLIPMEKAEMHIPVFIRDYTDFYSSIEHATNVGVMFRGTDNALMPNWKHLPVGYHGRASSIVVSGQNIHRPKGQILTPNTEQPVFKPSEKVDFELEMGFIIGKATALGDSVSTLEDEDFIFGKVLLNDWSARDIQKWEYVPLGPFLAKNFGSSISPWVVTMAALEPFKVKGPEQSPKVLPYLSYEGLKNYDINLEVAIQPKDTKETTVSFSNFKYMYWNMAQQLAHHTVNGCNINIGDMMASGTISGKSPNSYGSMLELAWGGKKPIKLENGEERTFINDNDTVIMRGYCEKNGIRIGFGEVKCTILPSKI